MHKKINESDLNDENIDKTFSNQKISNLSIKNALKIIHNPSIEDDIIKIKQFEHPAQKRLIIEELITNLIGVKISTKKVDEMKAASIPYKKESLLSFCKSFPFPLRVPKRELLKKFKKI